MQVSSDLTTDFLNAACYLYTCTHEIHCLACSCRRKIRVRADRIRRGNFQKELIDYTIINRHAAVAEKIMAKETLTLQIEPL